MRFSVKPNPVLKASMTDRISNGLRPGRRLRREINCHILSREDSSMPAEPKIVNSTQIVYVLTNPAMPGLVKIGKTSNLSRRLKSLDKTGVPLPFDCYFSARVADMHTAEKILHKLFGDDRINPRREFFRMPPEKARWALELAMIGAASEAKEFSEPEQSMAEPSEGILGKGEELSVLLGHAAPSEDADGNEGGIEVLRSDLLSAIQQIELVKLRQTKKNSPVYVDEEKHFAVVAVPSKHYASDLYWYTISGQQPDHYAANGFRVMFAFGMEKKNRFAYVPYDRMKEVCQLLHKKVGRRAWYMHLQLDGWKVLVQKAKTGAHVDEISGFMKPLHIDDSIRR
jgi:hypothetical protein